MELTAELDLRQLRPVRELVPMGRSDSDPASIPMPCSPTAWRNGSSGANELVLVVPPVIRGRISRRSRRDFAATSVCADPWFELEPDRGSSSSAFGLERVPATAAIGSTAGVIAMARGDRDAGAYLDPRRRAPTRAAARDPPCGRLRFGSNTPSCGWERCSTCGPRCRPRRPHHAPAVAGRPDSLASRSFSRTSERPLTSEPGALASR